MQHGQLRQTFTVTAVADAYADETMDLDAAASRAGALEVQALVEELPASAVAELWILRVDGVPTTDNDWINSGTSWNATGLQDLVALGGWRAQIKVKSGGSAGDAVVSAVVN